MFILQHLGYPTTKRIENEEWKKLSQHKTISAAYKAMDKRNKHLEPGQWDDHYRVVDKSGEVCQREYKMALNK